MMEEGGGMDSNFLVSLYSFSLFHLRHREGKRPKGSTTIPDSRLKAEVYLF